MRERGSIKLWHKHTWSIGRLTNKASSSTWWRNQYTEIKTLWQHTYCRQAHNLGYPWAVSSGNPWAAFHNVEPAGLVPTCGAAGSGCHTLPDSKNRTIHTEHPAQTQACTGHRTNQEKSGWAAVQCSPIHFRVWEKQTLQASPFSPPTVLWQVPPSCAVIVIYACLVRWTFAWLVTVTTVAPLATLTQCGLKRQAKQKWEAIIYETSRKNKILSFCIYLLHWGSSLEEFDNWDERM